MSDPKMERKPSAAEVQAALQAPEARSLLQMLQADGGKALSQASRLVQAGNYDQALSLLRPMVDSPAAAQLLRQLDQRLG